MTELKDFEIYLLIENNKLKIFLLDTLNLKNVYTNELAIDKNLNFNFEMLSKFLDDNIFKIEKLSGVFIDDIILMVDNNTELQTNVGIKKKNNNDIADLKSLNQALVELKDLFKENHKDQEIIHMLIENFMINGKNYKYFVDNLKSGYLNLDVKFITLPQKLVIKFNRIFERYQIKVKYFVSGRYLKNFKAGKDTDISIMAHKILNGYNKNEITIVPKIQENRGFFEKFFQLFS